MRNEPQPQPVTEAQGGGLLGWADAAGPIAAAGTYWLSTVRPDGGPHVMPVLGVWVDEALHFSSGPSTRKSRNLARNPSCAVSASRSGLDIVIVGRATMVHDTAELQRVAGTYRSKYGWEPTVRGGALHAEAGAPTAGPPPWDVYVVVPETVFVLPADGDFAATRWSF